MGEGTICKTFSITKARQQSTISRTVRSVKQKASQRLAHLVRYFRRVSGKDWGYGLPRLAGGFQAVGPVLAIQTTASPLHCAVP